MKREFYLKQHCNTIWQSETDGRWRTYVHTNGKRKAITSTTKEGLEDKLIKFYVIENQKLAVTINSLFPEFIQYKAKETSLANANKLSWAYEKYYRGFPISNEPMKEINTVELKTFLLEQISDFNLTKIAYREMKSLINMMYDYGIECGFLQENIARNIRTIPQKKFAPQKKKTASEQIYTVEQQKQMHELALQEFERTHNPAYLAVYISFFLALRVGEIVALKANSFDGDYLYIDSQELKGYQMDENGHITRIGSNIAPYTKTPESVRRIPIIPILRPVIAQIKAFNAGRGIESPYLFIGVKGQRMHADAVEKAISKMSAKLGYDISGNHAIRKTCLSNMYASGLLSKEEIRSFAGHRDISTTERCYVFANEDLDDRSSAYEAAITPCHRG